MEKCQLRCALGYSESENFNYFRVFLGERRGDEFGPYLAVPILELKGTIYGAGYHIRVSHMQSKCLNPCIISMAIFELF